MTATSFGSRQLVHNSARPQATNHEQSRSGANRCTGRPGTAFPTWTSPITGTSVPTNQNQPVTTKGNLAGLQTSHRGQRPSNQRHGINDERSIPMVPDTDRDWRAGWARRSCPDSGHRRQRCFPSGRAIEIFASVTTAPPFCCTMNVTTHEIALRTKNGIFSTTKCRTLGTRHPPPATLLSGHQSSNSITNGSVTSIGLLIRPSAKNKSASE